MEISEKSTLRMEFINGEIYLLARYGLLLTIGFKFSGLLSIAIKEINS
ncbi:hypothetical protein [Candidatus Contubernalis alkalaceticus]|nr:hypothetical protein [Candidatus Contubernalis alkalaceticus]UNC90606.1 hypothetical protein HUE98_08235 [Candidatus Contubernalis alkalaceticus]